MFRRRAGGVGGAVAPGAGPREPGGHEGLGELVAGPVGLDEHVDHVGGGQAGHRARSDELDAAHGVAAGGRSPTDE